ncbi:hypothetical protein BGZ65_011241 [Modicella reniformis]|uniref:Rhodanese domain-containing protein n=1 Tax=Modicella reniformis TaxID=1440133 RepID=A0A9P6LVU6_9FUNG|nr:hypothetical protein BGZ65_011241 [Modicella reniformis]
MSASQLRLASTVSRHSGLTLQQRAFSLSSFHQKSFGALVQEIKANNKNIHHMSPKDLHAAITTTPPPPHVIDVREQKEIDATGTIPGAIVLPRGILERDVGRILKQDDPRDVVVYCAGGFRSVLAAESLIRLGYGISEQEQQQQQQQGGDNNNNKPRVWSLDEGFDGWIKNGYNIDKK